MKKTLILISIFIMILVSCSGKKSAVNATANKTIGLPNPVQESTAEDIAKELNVKFAVPDGAKNIRYSIVSGNLAQMDFILNEAECTARIQRVSESEDISGFYYNWSNETPCTVGENAGIAKWQITEVGEVVGICLWQNKASNLTYSVSMKKNADSEKLIALANAVYITGGAPMTYKMVSMSEGLEIAKNNPDAIIVDVRHDDEYKAGHIPGAVLLTMETITAKTAAKVLPNKSQMILIYCRSGRRSKIAAQTLLELGYTNLIEFGGILDYKGKVEK
ncbi:rhodanese-like domain-containing protein [Treponema succinifaciens]|uniref:rhodanese-like domain-containing protein n=1 Tax=Treponema succinifaciens TaxID=167 RepID=UPI003FCE54BF